MEKLEIIKLLESVRDGKLSQDEVAEQLSSQGMDSLGYAVIDTDRQKRTGIPEVIYSSGKTPKQVAEISARMNERGIPVLATRADQEIYKAVREKLPGAVYHEMARIIMYQPHKPEVAKGYIAVVSAGTSDMPVSEEAAITAEFLGNRVERIYDVGVAGIHRLFHRIELIRGASVVIVAAGMEGALASVIGGMVDIPVIGIPCSTGYGANFGGVSALLSMLNSCAAGVSVVNIDNGFGAACQAHLINKSKCL
ncbi:MAG: nickel pincer cofactor biosynthesis protein LarB [Bacteroidales bacterium]